MSTFFKNEPFMSYQLFNKGGRVAKSPFFAKSVQKSLNKKNKIDFFQKQPFLNRQLLRNGLFFRKVTFHIVNRQKSCTLIVI